MAPPVIDIRGDSNMPTQHTFDTEYASNGNNAYSDNPTNVTITATVDDGTISVGDAVTASGLVNAPFNTGINNGDTIYYHGSGTFNGQTGYVFSASAVLSLPGPILVLTNVGVSIPTSDAVHAYATNASPQTLSNNAVCFASGTLITTPVGDQLVETLQIGDQVCTVDGRAVSIIWVGVQSILKSFAGARMRLVRLHKHSLRRGVPQADLMVTADHGMILDGLVISASALVNGDTIDFVPMAELEDSFTVYHIETENHDVILANGAPAETFVDAVTRSHFDNYKEYVDLYGAERIIPEMDRPRISAQRLVPEAIKARLGIAPIADANMSAALTA